MGFLFPSPKIPSAPPPPEPIPTRDSAAVQAKSNELKENLARKRRSGLATIQTSGLGDVSEPNIRRANLLGGNETF